MVANVFGVGPQSGDVASGAGGSWRAAVPPWLQISGAMIALGLFYCCLFQSYRAYEIDNPWYLSFSRSTWVDGYRGDLFLNGIFPDGMGGTVIFGRIPALIQGEILDHFQWLPVFAMLLSTAVVLSGLCFWYGFLRKSQLSVEACCAMVVALGLTEPFVGMAERFRYEPYSFLLLSIAFWLVSCGWWRLGLFTAMMAAEVEPAAFMVAATLVVFLVRSKTCRRSQLLYGVVVALFCFLAIYVVLHADVVQVLRTTDWHRGAAQRELGGFLRSYFFNRKRHIPELCMLCVGAYVCIRQRRNLTPLVSRMAECTIAVCTFSFVMGWPTPAYMVFFFPFALVVMAWALQTKWRNPWALPLLVSLLMIPQYGALAVINRSQGFRASDFRQVATAIHKSEQVEGLDDSQVEIMGDYSLWFAHPEHYRALSTTTREYMHSEQMFLCFDAPLLSATMVDPIVRYCSDLPKDLPLQDAADLDVRGHRLHIFVVHRTGP